MPLRRNGSVWREERKKEGGEDEEGLCDTEMYLAEEQESRRETAFPRVAHSQRKRAVLSHLKCHIFAAS